MKSFKTFLNERRAHADKNPRIPRSEQLRPWFNRDDISLHFTRAKKVGVNPYTQHATPHGVYAYPFKAGVVYYDIDWEDNSSTMDWPYRGNVDNIYVIQTTSKKILRPDEINDAWLKKMIPTLKKLFYKRVKSTKKFKSNTRSGLNFETVRHYMNRKEWDTSKMELSKKQYVDRLLEETLTTSLLRLKSYEPWERFKNTVYGFREERGATAVQLNVIYRQLGFEVIDDSKGTGFIHSNEPCQILYLSPSSYKVVDYVSNKVQKYTAITVDDLKKEGDDNVYVNASSFGDFGKLVKVTGYLLKTGQEFRDPLMLSNADKKWMKDFLMRQWKSFVSDQMYAGRTAKYVDMKMNDELYNKEMDKYEKLVDKWLAHHGIHKK